MGKLSLLLVVLLALLLVSADVLARRDSEQEEEEARRREREQEEREREQERGQGHRGQAFRDLKPRQPREIFRSEGGRIEAYDPSDYQALCDAEIGAKRVTIEPNGLALPCYKDSNLLLAVTEGRARAGIISPFADRVTERAVFELKKGDVVAIPRGFASWFCNDGNERFQFIDFSDTSTSTACGCFKTFLLAGQAGQKERGQKERGQKERQQEFGGGVLQGFSKEILAHAWDVDESMVQRVLEGQSGSVIIKVDERHKKQLPSVTNSGLYMDFVYRLGDSHPDVKVRDGGELRQLNSLKMPILKKLEVSASCVKLEGGALKAPAWVHNAHKVIYGVKGSGRIQVVRENGEQAVDAKMEEGSLLVVPANYPCAKLASDQGFEFGVFYKTDLPIESFLAGRNSVYKGIPGPVISSSLQIDEKLQQKLEQRRTDEAFIFPRRKRQPRRQEDGFSFVENVVHTFV